jgi:hypothetical protein
MLSAFAGIGLSRLLPAAGALGALGVLGIAVGIPVAVAVAILRHRLYDIDRLINRTLVYGLLTAILGLGYAGVVLVLGEVFGGVGAEPPSWAVAGATPGHGRPVPAGPASHPSGGGSALQPAQVQRGHDHRDVQRPAARPGRP